MTPEETDYLPLWKVPRTHHCSVCERCCAKYDHHCGMAINCIGINNYKLFTLFLVTTILVRFYPYNFILKHLIVSSIVNVKVTMTNVEDQTYLSFFLSLVLLIHNLATCYYNYQLATWYFSMAGKNMHAVEETIIGNVYDKARYHQLISKDEPKKFYYTRKGGWLQNFYEMIGTRNLFFWLLPFPHYNRQYI